MSKYTSDGINGLRGIFKRTLFHRNQLTKTITDS